MTNTLLILLAEGMKGEPLPYMLRSEWMITGILFLCIIIVCYVFSKEKKHLQQQFRDLFTSRERGSFFDDATSTDIRHTITLILHTCIVLGICAYHYSTQSLPTLIQQSNHIILYGFFVVLTVIYMLVKWGIYGFINWIFFDKTRNLSWTNAYFTVFIWLGLILLPIILLVAYFNLSVQTSFYLIVFAIFAGKLLLFCKCFSNFFPKIHGFFHLILYFCALEILPDLLLWKGIFLSSNNLILNI